MADLDLTRGRPEPAPPLGGRPKPSGVNKAAAEERAEKALKGDLESVFVRLSALFDAREDEELSQIFAEDKAVLSQGLVSITDAVLPFRKPLVVAVKLVEPILAFGRLGGVLVRRARERFVYEEEQPPVAS